MNPESTEVPSLKFPRGGGLGIIWLLVKSWCLFRLRETCWKMEAIRMTSFCRFPESVLLIRLRSRSESAISARKNYVLLSRSPFANDDVFVSFLYRAHAPPLNNWLTIPILLLQSEISSRFRPEYWEEKWSIEPLEHLVNIGPHSSPPSKVRVRYRRPENRPVISITENGRWLHWGIPWRDNSLIALRHLSRGQVKLWFQMRLGTQSALNALNDPIPS
jgi:hypothetical protein